MKYTKTLGAIGLALSLNSQAALIDLTGQGYVTYGDFNSYSLPIAGINVPSTPGQIDDLIVVATGSSGQPVNTNFSGMDNAYSTPTGVSGSNFFSTGSTTDPSQVNSFTGDNDATWDTTLAALDAFLAGEDMVLFFNNNNLNAENEQSLAVWAQIQVTDNNSDVIGVFDFTNDGGKYGLVSEGGGGTFFGDPTAYTSDGLGPDIGTNDSTDYVLSGGAICIDTDTSPPTPVSCTSPLADEGPINHNLGADDAAYAVVAPELNSLLQGLFDSGLNMDDYTMSIDLRLGCDPGFGLAGDEICTGVSSGFGKNINNGFEQLFIASATFEPEIQIPEPSTLLLLGGGLLVLCRRNRLLTN
ncbi:MAG: PEP-CTERM sorting domain-containing protein [Colwellia sp.]|nr:PEP-CTERM sorting domain-containing protein [Colwellia sp.]